MSDKKDNPLERMRPDDLEAEQSERAMSTGEAGADGFAKGVDFSILIDDPWVQIATIQPSWDPHDPFKTFEFTDEEKKLWTPWIEAQYPKLSFNYDADDQTEATVCGEYQEGESTTDLFYRVIKDTGYVELLNRGTVFYYLAIDFMQHCMDIRRGIIPKPQEVN